MVEAERPPTSWFAHALSRSWLVEQFGARLWNPFSEWVDDKLRRPLSGHIAAPEVAPDNRRSLLVIVIWATFIVLVLYGAYRAVEVLTTLSKDVWRDLGLGLLATCARVAVALIITLLWTVPVGVLIGTNRRLANILQPIVQVIAAVPATALFPIVLLALLAGEPPIHNLFPICNSPQVYKRQVEQRDRLDNVPDNARTIIESLQPYNAKGGKRFSHPLYILNKLINADRYRLPALTVTCRAQPTFIYNEPNGPNRIKVTSITEPFNNGARLTNQCLLEIQADEVTMHIERGIYLPFRDLPGTDSAADTVLGNVIWFVKNHVVPRFESFFEQRSEASVFVAYK